ncbi:MAG: hypothetical protein SOR75_00070 [Synergistes jonesii]|uniref:aspartate-alanine antiporter-like transporter n=1 Tax=Synergistes jonesii TaxID=2754 RepID=UPI002A75F47F|nr:hypothetical protein [Synergistes jonesii]MDY2983710.1 hypothetical protein [Synergistes jonesii]
MSHFFNGCLLTFIIVIIGYAVGSVEICKLHLGTSGILFVALLFGHFGAELSPTLQNLGLMIFVGAVGLIAAPEFLENFKRGALSFLLLGIIIVGIGGISTYVFMKIFDLPVALSLGMMAGALTSTPALATAIEATADATASVGYGIAYPFGVFGVVLFVQLVPKILKIDFGEEVKNCTLSSQTKSSNGERVNLISLDHYGFSIFALCLAVGTFIADTKIPIMPGKYLKLGASGGPLLAGLLLGNIKHIWRLSFKIDVHLLNLYRELGLVLFLTSAGTRAGKGFVEIVSQYGITLFVVSALITLMPMIIGYVVAKYLLRLGALDIFGSICGGMTSTPALGTLIDISATNLVAVPYASTYPFALIGIMFIVQIIYALC